MEKPPSESDKPLGLKSWVDKLSKVRLPIQPLARSNFLKQLAEDGSSSSKLASIAETDPAFCFHLFNEANKQLAKSGNEARSLEHLISLLGRDRIKELVRGLPAPDKNSKPEQQQAYLQAQAVSVHAACLAQQIAKIKMHCNPEQIYYSTLFYDVIYWAFCQCAEYQMAFLHELKAIGKLNSDSAEKNIFGCRILEIAKAMTDHWALPLLTQQSFDNTYRPTPADVSTFSKLDATFCPEPLPDDNDLVAKLNSSHLTILVSSQLAHEADWNWYSKSTLNCHKVICNQLYLPLPQVLRMTHGLAVDLSRRALVPNTIGPAEKLFCYYDAALLRQPSAPDASSDAEKALNTLNVPNKNSAAKLTAPATERSEKFGSKPTKKNQLSPEPQPAIRDPKKLRLILRSLNNTPENFKNITTMMAAAMQAAIEGIGVDRITVMLLNKQKSLLQTQHSLNMDNEQLRKYSYTCPVKLDESKDLFGQMLIKPMSLHTTEKNIDKAMARLPKDFKSAFDANNFFLDSLFYKNTPLGLIYADSGKQGAPLSDEQYKCFKQLCHCLKNCINHLPDDHPEVPKSV